MNKKVFAGILFGSLFISSQSFSQETPVCVIKGAPSPEFKYSVIKKLKVGKGSYGGVADIQPIIARLARESGGEAIIYYNGSQRFGFWPWRMVRPVITGTAIRWDASNEKPFPCVEQGGFFI